MHAIIPIQQIFANIINQSKAENLIVLELQDLLLQLKNITVFDGLQLFIDVIESKEQYEAQKIKEFLTIHLEDIAMFDSVYLYIKDLNIQIQDSVQLDEVKDFSFASDEKESIKEELEEGFDEESSSHRPSSPQKPSSSMADLFSQPSQPRPAPKAPPPPSPAPQLQKISRRSCRRKNSVRY